MATRSDPPDFVIVGGGVMGLSIGLHLARAGARPLVLERRFAGSGSTGKSGAIIRQHYSLELTAAMARDSLVEYSEFEERVGRSAGFVRTGMALLVDPGHRAGLVANVAMQRELGIGTRVLEAAELREILPGAAAPDDSVGCYEPDAGFADPLATLDALGAALERSGGAFRADSPVLTIHTAGSRVIGVLTSNGEIAAERVVVAAGPWSAALVGATGAAADVSPARVRTAVFARPHEHAGGPVVIDFVNRMYAKHSTETHVGSIDPSEIEPADPDLYDEGVDARYVQLAHDRLTRRYPALANAVRLGGFGALYAVTPDWHPLIGPTGPDGLYLCAGFSGHGFKLAPAVGRTVAAELLGTDPPYDFEAFRPGRFEADRPVVGRYSYSIIG